MSDSTMRYDSAPARRRSILDALRVSGFVSVADLTRDLGVSDMTIRRDLRKLEQSGEVRVVRGGVSVPHGPLHAPAFVSRAGVAAEAKRRIAEAAVGLIGPADSIAIDAGTTTYALAEALPDDFLGSVVTHSVPVIQLMLNRGSGRVVGLGGDVLPESQAFVGPMTVDAAAGLRVRTLFLGAAAVDDRGVYVATDIERPTKQALIDIADQVVLLADHTKFTTSAPVLLCPWNRVATVVTDQPPSRSISDQLTRTGVTLRLPTEP